MASTKPCRPVPTGPSLTELYKPISRVLTPGPVCYEMTLVYDWLTADIVQDDDDDVIAEDTIHVDTPLMCLYLGSECEYDGIIVVHSKTNVSEGAPISRDSFFPTFSFT
mmetsp:Transcript_5938/g.8438  ORF Transcript_5938/g.8438 Transcript_5938/m.8438 type:complete len:109 (+) Transcript_5938:1354-1680(+)